MSDENETKGQSGGVNISGGQVTVGQDIVGGDKIITHGGSAGEITDLQELFALIRQKIDTRPEDPNVDKDELRDIIEKTEQEVKKGDKANRVKVERWLGFLAEMAEDIFEVTVAALVSPAAGVAKTIQLIAQKAKEERAASH